METYTFGQCARMLDVDPKIFREWVKEDLGLAETDQVSKSDRRVRYLTREQVDTLARLHEIALLPEQPALKDETPQSVYKLLADRVTTVEQFIERLGNISESVAKMREQFSAELERMYSEQGLLAQRMAIIEEHFPLTEEHVVPQTQAVSTEQQVAEIEQRYLQRIAALEEELAQYRQKEQEGSKSKKRKAAKSLPTHLTSRSVFAALHNVPDGTVATACKQGKIAAVQGRWLYKHRIINQALGERGKHEFYQLYHERPDFTRCPQCPHELSKNQM